MNTLTWDDIIADRSLRDLPYKIETNRHNQIIMSPASFWHRDYQGEITVLLGRLLPGGKVPVECAIQTSEGVRVPDAAWISLERRAPHRARNLRGSALPVQLARTNAGENDALFCQRSRGSLVVRRAWENGIFHCSQRAAVSPNFAPLSGISAAD